MGKKTKLPRDLVEHGCCCPEGGLTDLGDRYQDDRTEVREMKALTHLLQWEFQKQAGEPGTVTLPKN